MAAVASVLLGVWLSKYKSDARLELVSVDLGVPPAHPHLDLKLRNLGERSAVIKAVELHVSREWRLHPSFHPTALLTSSAQYEIKVPEKQAPFVVTSPASLVVEPGAVERFGITLTVDNADEASRWRKDLHRVLLLSADVVYNGDERRATDPVIVTIGGPWADLMYCDGLLKEWEKLVDIAGDPRPMIRANRRAALEIASQTARKDPLTEAIVKALSCPMLETLDPPQ